MRLQVQLLMALRHGFCLLNEGEWSYLSLPMYISKKHVKEILQILQKNYGNLAKYILFFTIP